MTTEDYIQIFNECHPGFFDESYVRAIPEQIICEEMFLALSDFSEEAQEIPIPDGVSFGIYTGDLAVLHRAVASVAEDWVQWFREESTVFCAYQFDEIASFCLLDPMGEHIIGGQTLRVAGPGCVGTVPKFRRQGIGLAMVQKATAILKQRGYDLSYIHYTGVANWYARLGYRTEIRWNCRGIL